MFAVKDIEDVLARLSARGAELVGEVEQYEPDSGCRIEIGLDRTLHIGHDQDMS